MTDQITSSLCMVVLRAHAGMAGEVARVQGSVADAGNGLRAGDREHANSGGERFDWLISIQCVRTTELRDTRARVDRLRRVSGLKHPLSTHLHHYIPAFPSFFYLHCYVSSRRLCTVGLVSRSRPAASVPPSNSHASTTAAPDPASARLSFRHAPLRPEAGT